MNSPVCMLTPTHKMTCICIGLMDIWILAMKNVKYEQINN